MQSVTYEDVVKLADQLSPADQYALIVHLQSLAASRSLNNEEWKSLLRASISSVPAAQDISNRREDWYGDDGR